MGVQSVTSPLPSRRDAIVGSLLGMAVGDALGLAYEGLSARRAHRILGEPDRYRLLPNRGLISDDTEHACMVSQALIVAGGDVVCFRQDLARRLRWWLVRVPAGIGLATLRSILRLWVGYSPQRSGVFSAGNGPCMRSPLLGAAIDDLTQLRAFVSAATCLTHSDPKADSGAVAVALASYLAGRSSTVSGDDFLTLFRNNMASPADAQLEELLSRAVASADSGNSTMQFATELGLQRGVSGYVMHTVPVVIHAWLQNPVSFRQAVTAVIRCGGDTDTTGAIVGAIVGSRVGKAGIPAEWLESFAEWPQSLDWIESLGNALHEALEAGEPRHCPTLPIGALLARNLFFATIVLAHGFRRLLPPY
jgi:ADP-ribosyl-[dinitrogen reductase] hydrolase